MADPTINWITGLIFVPQSYLTLISGSVYELDVDAFRLKLRDLEEDIDGRPWPKTHNHNTSVLLSGVTYARVLTFLAPYTIEFEDGNYSISCIGANHNIADKKVVNSVSLIINNAAGLIDVNKEDIEHSAYNNGVTIDIINGVSGIEHPTGTPRQPSSNLTDAKIIAVARGLSIIYINGDLTIGATDNVDGYNLIGKGPSLSAFTFVSGSSTIRTIVKECHILGELSGAADISDCHVEELSGVGGTSIGTNINRCILEADSGDAMTLSASSTEHIHMVGCSAGSKSNNPTNINCNGSAAFMTISYWGGGIFFKNMTNATQEITINSTGGDITIDSTCTAGTIIIYGAARLTDNSDGAVTIIDKTTATLTNAYLERGVWIDTEQVAAGEGSQKSPFNTLTAAIDYAENEGIKTLYVYADIILDRQLKNFKVIGIGTPTVDTNGQDLSKSEFWHCRMEGSYIGDIIVQQSLLLNNFWLNGHFEKNGIAGNLFAVDGANIFMMGNGSAIAGLGRPTISMNVTGSCKLSIRKQSGGLTIRHCNNALDEVTAEISEGSMTFDNTNDLQFDGQMVARGGCKFVDETTGFAVADETDSTTFWQKALEGTITAEQMIRLIASLSAAKVSGMDANAPVFRDLADTKDRLSATVSNGNRLTTTIGDLT